MDSGDVSSVGISVLLLTLTGAAAAEGFCGEVRSPIADLDIRVSTKSVSELISGFRRFAADNGFQIQAAPTSSDPIDIMVELWRDDLDVIASTDDPSTQATATFDLGFYLSCRRAEPVGDETLQRLIESLRVAIADISGISIVQNEIPK